MLKKFPFLYIAWLYVFSTKDKIIFYMQQFASLIIALCLAVIICSFSLMNGFSNQIQERILKYSSPITMMPKSVTYDTASKENLNLYNTGFEKPVINNSHVTDIKYIRNQYTFAVFDDEENLVSVYEDTEQTVPIIIGKGFANNIIKKKKDLPISIVDSNSYNSLIGGPSRQKFYSTYEVNNDEDDTKSIRLSSTEYQKLFRNTNYNMVKIYLDKIEYTTEVSQKLSVSLKNSNIQISTWEKDNSSLFNALELQRKILFLVYIVIFTLLCAIIVSTNVSFFKDKRKDWALIKLLDVGQFGVESIFLYKNLISFLISTFLGVVLGVIFTIYSNEILNFTQSIFNNGIPISSMFGANSITYEFYFIDFVQVISFSFVVFFINFILLLVIFRKENIANFLKAP